MSDSRFKVAAAHVAPVYLDRAGTIEKACSIVREAALHGARLVAFPETYVPAFPVWLGIRAPIENHGLFVRLANESLLLPGPELDRLRDEARRGRILISIGFNERSASSVGCLWNTNVLIGEDGAVLNHHRKMVPTFYEKLVWAVGDGAGLKVCDTPAGKVGMLICGENTNPLARYSLIAQGEQVHISSYPPVWPTRDPRDGGNYDLAAAIRIRASAHSFEAKAFNIVVSGFMDRAMRDALVSGDRNVGEILDLTPRGISFVTAPTGEVLSGVLSGEEGILYQEIDLDACVEPKQIHDVAGHYNRFDIFELTVNRRRLKPIVFEDPPPDPGPPPAPRSDSGLSAPAPWPAARPARGRSRRARP